MSMLTSPQYSKALYEGIADSLRERIFSHELPPLARILESEVHHRYHVARPAVREALKLLAREGLLKKDAPGGYCVMAFSRADLEGALSVIEWLYCDTLRGMAQRYGGSGDNADGAAQRERAAANQRVAAWRWEEVIEQSPFSSVIRNLYLQLRACLGPAFRLVQNGVDAAPKVELQQAIGEGNGDKTQRLGWEQMRQFRTSVLVAYDLEHGWKKLKENLPGMGKGIDEATGDYI